jgi:small subunit ribosomal protein S6
VRNSFSFNSIGKFPKINAILSLLPGVAGGPEVHREEFVNQYDTTFIINGDLGQKEREAIILQARDSLVKKGADINRIVRWGMRTLAYEIKKKTRGYYVIYYYCAPPAIIKDFERELRLNENILRYMTIKSDGIHPSYIPDEGEPGSTPITVAIPEIRDEATVVAEAPAEQESIPGAEEQIGGDEEFTDESLDETDLSDDLEIDEDNPASDDEEGK